MANTNWVKNAQNKLGNMSETSTQGDHWKKRSIYKVHPCIVNLNRKAFTPQVVSFGPYHHEDENLKLMEEHKERALLQFLKRSKKPFEAFVHSLSPVVDELKNSYDPLGPEWRENGKRFLHMMILDGCFMLEILRVATVSLNEYATSDPIFGPHGRQHAIPLFKRDMLMIENQLPILLLDTLLAAEGKKEEDEESAKTDTQDEESAKRNTQDEESANRLILKFFGLRTPLSELGKPLHVLDVYRKSLILGEPSGESHHPCSRPNDIPGGSSVGSHHAQSPPSGVNISDDDIVRSATELREAGIWLRSSKTSSLRDITFKRGVLRLPTIIVDDTTESAFLNLMAFERFHVGECSGETSSAAATNNEVTSYIFFMDRIIDTERDVALLISSGIIRNALGSNNAVAELFNSLLKDTIIVPDAYMGLVHRRVNAYSKKKWNAWRAHLCHTYFHNPWAMLSLIAAIFLFALTIGQTVYTVYPYYYPRGN